MSNLCFLIGPNISFDGLIDHLIDRDEEAHEASLEALATSSTPGAPVYMRESEEEEKSLSSNYNLYAMYQN